MLLRIEGAGAAARRAAEAAAMAPSKDAAAAVEKFLPEISQAVAVRLTLRAPALALPPMLASALYSHLLILPPSPPPTQRKAPQPPRLGPVTLTA